MWSGVPALPYDYEENCFREEAENDAYVLYSVGSRKVKLAADFLYADHSSVANPGDPEPEWARGDAAAFPDYSPIWDKNASVALDQTEQAESCMALIPTPRFAAENLLS